MRFGDGITFRDFTNVSPFLIVWKIIKQALRFCWEIPWHHHFISITRWSASGRLPFFKAQLASTHQLPIPVKTLCRPICHSLGFPMQRFWISLLRKLHSASFSIETRSPPFFWQVFRLSDHVPPDFASEIK